MAWLNLSLVIFVLYRGQREETILSFRMLCPKNLITYIIILYNKNNINKKIQPLKSFLSTGQRDRTPAMEHQG